MHSDQCGGRGVFFLANLIKKMRLSLPLLIGHSQLEIEFNLASIQEDKQGYGLRTERFKRLSKREKVWFQVLTEKQTCKVFYIKLFRPCPSPPWGQVPLLRFYLWLLVVVGELMLYLGLCSWWSGVPYWLEWCWGLVWGQAALLRLPEGSDVSIRSKIHGGRKTKLTLKSRHALVCTIYDSNKCRNANLHGKVVREAPV